MSKAAATTLVFFCFLALSEERLFVADKEIMSLSGSEYNSKADQVKPMLVTKVLGDLITSEYNRVTRANQQLYIQSRAPSVACKEKDISSCHMTVYLVETPCSRFTSNPNCKPAMMDAVSKKCMVMVNLLTANVFSPLRCRNGRENVLPEEMDDTSYFFKNSPEDYNAGAWNKEENAKTSKKQWSIYDGNPFPL